MIVFLEGVVAGKRVPGELVINVGGVGFQLNCSTMTLSSSPETGKTALIYTRMITREDGMDLYGFMTSEERGMFDMLRSVSGIGCRTALAMLSTMNVNEMNRAIALSDAAAIARAPGVGKKTAQRVILDLKDKIVKSGYDGSDALGAPVSQSVSAEREAADALASLGYSKAEAERAVMKAMEGFGDDIRDIKSDELIMRALKRINA